MKRLMLLVSLIVITLLIGCTQKESYENMTALDPPIEMRVRLDFFYETLWVTHEYVMNEEEVLYYSPKSVRIDGNVYLNDNEEYFIKWTNSEDPEDCDWERCTEAMLKEIFRE